MFWALKAQSNVLCFTGNCSI